MIRPERMVLGLGAVALGALSVAIIVGSDSSGEAPAGTTALASENVRPWSCPSGTPLTATCLYVASSTDPSVQQFVVRVDVEGAVGNPLLVLGDGPGVAVSDQLRELVPLSRDLGRDLIVMDPPGSGRSRPSLDCPELDTDSTRPSLSSTQFSEAVAACRDRMAAADLDLTISTTAATADRIEDVRRALGVETWAVLVGGENTRLGLELARRSGPSVVESLVITSPLLGEYNPYVDVGVPAVEALLAACGDDPACRSQYGGLETSLDEAVAALVDNPFVLATGTGGAARAQRVLATDALIGLDLLVADDATRPAVPRLITNSIEVGDWTEVAEVMAANQRQSVSVGALLGRRCAEDAPRTEPKAQESLKEKALGWAAVFSGTGAVDLCTVWNVPAATLPVADSDGVTIRTLLVRGRFDPISRPEDLAGLGAALPDSVAVEILASGGSALSTPCGRKIVAEFLMDLSAVPDTDCAGDTGPDWAS